MADFGYFSDTDDSAVDELISQTKELCVLEQVSAINCSGFTDSLLPTELEQRFRKLKSFPATKPNPTTNINDTPRANSLPHSKSEVKYSEKDHEAECETFSDPQKNPDGKMGLEGKPVPECDSSPLNSSNSSTENEIFSDSKQNPDGKTNLKEKSKRGAVSVSVSKSKSCSSPLSTSNSWMGCLWCSPKSGSKKKSKENRVLSSSLEWGNTDELLSDLTTFSAKEQQKMLKKAMKEEEKVSREAEKIVKWAKQASMRIRVHDSEDELSDD
ncbi:hypothetical protein ACOSP7_001680 [Xanthoceras sorbifolium]|uniref:Uncharacterized protein n=1 Tax=Xanthoceras sorbifolium TaxID=99658 RepID=A0ABQ8IL25_9ROSI|nr:hypothetical protein JRO89_XS01G0248400 [Xanthoceras sorbifolium]